MCSDSVVVVNCKGIGRHCVTSYSLKAKQIIFNLQVGLVALGFYADKYFGMR